MSEWEWLSQIPTWVWAGLFGLATTIFLWWRRQTAGLSFFQEATEDERDKLEELMRERLDFLEDKVERLEEEVSVYKDALNCGDD